MTKMVNQSQILIVMISLLQRNGNTVKFEGVKKTKLISNVLNVRNMYVESVQEKFRKI